MRLFPILLLASIASAQPRTVELFAHTGGFRFAGDEGSLGGAVSYGGGAMLPFTKHLAVDLDIQTSHLATDAIGGNHYTEWRTFLSPSVVYRGGSERLYGFAGGGIGAQLERSRVSITNPATGALTNFTSSNTGMTYHGTGGVVGAITPRLLIRADAFIAFRYVLPTIGARIGIGVRF